MQVVILCGGQGTRLREETEFRPKPMVPIGGRPILWHIMKTYATHGHKEFILCLGYKGDMIKEYFRNYQWNTSDVTLRLGRQPKITYHTSHDEEDWTVTLLDTGAATQTGGRLQRALPFIREEDFLFTYGDGLTNSKINESIAFHRQHGRLVTLTAVQPPGRFGDLTLEGAAVVGFKEKPQHQVAYINGGFFVLNRRVGEYLAGDAMPFEQEPLARLSAAGQVQAFKHDGFWQCMDTYREMQDLNDLWASGQAPWKTW
jgi:glucose-1-phosphate cytidylyltransferase